MAFPGFGHLFGCPLRVGTPAHLGRRPLRKPCTGSQRVSRSCLGLRVRDDPHDPLTGLPALLTGPASTTDAVVPVSRLGVLPALIGDGARAADLDGLLDLPGIGHWSGIEHLRVVLPALRFGPPTERAEADLMASVAVSGHSPTDPWCSG